MFPKKSILGIKKSEFYYADYKFVDSRYAFKKLPKIYRQKTLKKVKNFENLKFAWFFMLPIIFSSPRWRLSWRLWALATKKVSSPQFAYTALQKNRFFRTFDVQAALL